MKAFRLGTKGATKARVTRMRSLTPGQVQRLQALRQFAQLLDSAFVIPGTSYRFGLDPIVGLVPGLGDLISPLFTIGILWQSRDLRIPRVVQMRMLMNVGIDTLLGIAPVIGDVFDVAWKANDMNYALLEQHALEERRPSRSDWLFVSLMIMALLVMAAAPVALFLWAIDAIAN